MKKIVNIGHQVKYKKGEILLRPDDQQETAFFVLEGIVHAYTYEHENINIVTMYGEKDFFPASYLIKKKPLNIYYEALTDCEVLRVREDKLNDLLENDVKASNYMLKQITRQFIFYKAIVDNLSYRFARERIAYRLLLLGKKFGHQDNSHIVMPRFSQEEIGNSTNVRRESVNRELKRFERLKYISYESHMLILTNSDGLRHELASEDSPLFIDDL